MSGNNKTRAVRRRLLRWYAANARELPWRRTTDPYAIWVSEIMLQQTRVDTVVPYYERFMERFPSVEALAQAGEQDVLSLWSGLGYYRRARLLHGGAKQVHEDHAGVLPRDAEARRKIAGIGAYTAGAIGSIAYGLREAIVDGNVKRVLSRVYAVEDPINARKGEGKIWQLAANLVDGPDPGALNQAMMELGALVCTPTKPDCGHCPVRKECEALASGRVETLPKKNAKKAAREEHWTVVAPLRLADRKIALTQRSGERFGGLWTLPMQLAGQNADARQMLRSHGIRARLRDATFTVRHQLTHRDMRLNVHIAVGASITQRRPDVRFISLDRKPRLPTASLTHKLLAGVCDVLA